jgi:hypothetical protein
MKLEKENKDIYDIISQHRQSLPKLAHLCRFEIRRRLNKVHGGRSLARHVRHLPLPELLRDLVMLNDLKDET